MLNYFDSKEAKQAASSSSLWENLAKPVIEINSGKYEEKLTNKELLIVEKFTGELISKLKYIPISSNQEELKKLDFMDKEIANFRLLNEKAKMKTKKTMPEKDYERRQFQLSFLEEIKKQRVLIDE